MTNEGTNMRKHLTEDDFRKWDSGSMSPEEMEYFLSHTASCDTCADSWMTFMAQAETETLLEPPVYLEEEIISRSRQPDLLIAQKINRTSRQIQLLTYSLKVCTAVALSIIMLFSINLTSLKTATLPEPSPITEEQQDITGHLRNGAQTITESLQNFTKSVFQFEFDFNFHK